MPRGTGTRTLAAVPAQGPGTDRETVMSATTTAGWQVQGNAADAYEAYLVPAIFTPMSRRLVEVADVRPGDRVLDVACGTGVVARAAAERVGSTGVVVGVDLNPDMLDTAARATAGLVPAVDLRQGDVHALPFEDDRFDVTLCEEALQFFADRVGALREMRRVTAPGGRVACSVLRSTERNPVYEVLATALGEFAGSAAETMMRSPFALGDADTLRADARTAGLTDVHIRIAVSEERFPSVAEFVRREAASSPLAGPLGALADDRREALVGALEERLAAHRDDDGLTFHNETHILTGHA